MVRIPYFCDLCLKNPNVKRKENIKSLISGVKNNIINPMFINSTNVLSFFFQLIPELRECHEKRFYGLGLSTPLISSSNRLCLFTAGGRHGTWWAVSRLLPTGCKTLGMEWSHPLAAASMVSEAPPADGNGQGLEVTFLHLTTVSQGFLHSRISRFQL